MLYLRVHIILCFIPLLHNLDVNIGLSSSALRVRLSKLSEFYLYILSLIFYKHLPPNLTSHRMHEWKNFAAVRLCDSGPIYVSLYCCIVF